MRALFLAVIAFTGAMGCSAFATDADRPLAKPHAKHSRPSKFSGLATTPAPPTLTVARPATQNTDTPSAPNWTGFHVGATFGHAN